MQVGCWIQQVATRVGAVTYWIQQPLTPKQVAGFSCVFNCEVDQLSIFLAIYKEMLSTGVSRLIFGFLPASLDGEGDAQVEIVSPFTGDLHGEWLPLHCLFFAGDAFGVSVG